MAIVEHEVETQTPEEFPQVLDPAVERGAAWLDKNAPGWAAMIDLDNFDIQDPSCCVLHYVFGDFREGTEIIERQGFYWGRTGLGFSDRELNPDWRLAILSRRHDD